MNIKRKQQNSIKDIKGKTLRPKIGCGIVWMIWAYWRYYDSIMSNRSDPAVPGTSNAS